MVKKFSVPCDFSGQKFPFTIYVGEPEVDHHPLHFQAEWLSKHRGGSIPGDVMESVAKLYELSKRNNVSFEELCVYALSDELDSGKSDNEAPPPPGDEPPAPM